MKLSTSSMGGFGVLFAEDFDDEGSMLLACEAPVPPTPETREKREGPDPATETFSAADIAQARRAGHEAGFAEGVASASEAASVTQASLLATMTERFAAARHDLDALMGQQLAAVTGTSLAIISACLPVLCERAGTHDLLAVLEGLLPSLIGEPELVVTVHPDLGPVVEPELVVILGKNTPFEVRTSPSMGRSDVDIAWRSGSAKRNARALRHEVMQTLRRSLRGESTALIDQEHRHGR